MGLPYTVYDLQEKIEVHEGWRDDHSTDVMAVYANTNQGMPVILIDGKGYSYGDAMLELKGRLDGEPSV